MDGVTATTAELNYVDGVTSAIQTQIDSKQALYGRYTIDDAILRSRRFIKFKGKVAVRVTAQSLGI